MPLAIHGFLDESGKVHTQKVVSVAGVFGYQKDFDNFSQEWGRLLHINGLKELSAKNVLNPNKPLSVKNDDTGLEKRIRDLVPFVDCIRKTLPGVTGMALDAEAFNQLSGEFHKRYDRDPVFMSFVRTILHVVDFTPPKDLICLTFDDDEASALKFYQLYRRVKQIWPPARKKLVAVSFADDRHLFGLQAADFMAAIIRFEMTKKMKQTKHDYEPIFAAMTKQPERYERIIQMDVAICEAPNLKSLAEKMKEEWEAIEREQTEG